MNAQPRPGAIAGNDRPSTSFLLSLRRFCSPRLWLRYKSLLRLFSTKDKKLKEEFHEASLATAASALDIWGIVWFLISVAELCRDAALSKGYMKYIPDVLQLTICLGAMLVARLPCARRRVMVVASIAALLMSFACGLSLRLVANSREDILRLKVPSIVAAHPEVLSMPTTELPLILQEPVAYVEKAEYMMKLGNSSFRIMLQFIMLAQVGCSWSSILATVATVPAFVLVPILSGALLMPTVYFWMKSLPILLVVIPLMVNLTFHQRSVVTVAAHSRAADSILNHTLKNKMVDALAKVSKFIDATAPDKNVAAPLHDAIALMQQAIYKCRYREVFFRLAAGTYVPDLKPIQLLQFVRDQAVGTLVRLSAPGSVVQIDPILLGLILDNALSNAFKHGHPEDPEVQLSINTGTTNGEQESQVHLEVCVTNRANPSRPMIDDDYITSVRRQDGSRHGPDPMSDQIGLNQSFLAAEVHGLSMSLTQQGNHVTLRVRGIVDTGGALQPINVDDGNKYAAELAVFPADLHIHCIDDSEGARHMLESLLPREANTEYVRVFGETPLSWKSFLDEAILLSDIVIMDQNLDYGTVTIKGTELVKQFLEARYRGLICIRSANDEDDDREEYTAAGAHCVFGKDITIKKMAREMKVAYVRHKGLH